VVETVEVRQEVARLRRQFADRIEMLDETAWNSASWCTGWRVRDLLAHLVRGAEMTPLSLTRDLLRGGLRPDRAVSNAAKRLGDVPSRSWLIVSARRPRGFPSPRIPQGDGLR